MCVYETNFQFFTNMDFLNLFLFLLKNILFYVSIYLILFKFKKVYFLYLILFSYLIYFISFNLCYFLYFIFYLEICIKIYTYYFLYIQVSLCVFMLGYISVKIYQNIRLKELKWMNSFHSIDHRRMRNMCTKMDTHFSIHSIS